MRYMLFNVWEGTIKLSMTKLPIKKLVKETIHNSHSAQKTSMESIVEKSETPCCICDLTSNMYEILGKETTKGNHIIINGRRRKAKRHRITNENNIIRRAKSTFFCKELSYSHVNLYTSCIQIQCSCARSSEVEEFHPIWDGCNEIDINLKSPLRRPQFSVFVFIIMNEIESKSFFMK